MLGGDMGISEYRFTQKTITEDHRLYQVDERNSGSRSFDVFMVIWVAMYGIRPYVLPSLFQCGVAEGIIIALVTFAASLLSIYLYIRTWVFGTTYTYIGIWRLTFGPRAAAICSLLVFPSYVFMIAEGYSEIGAEWNSIQETYWSGASYIFKCDWFVTLAFVLVAIFLIGSWKGLRGMKIASYISAAFSIASIVCIAIVFAKSVSKSGFDPQKKLITFTSDKKKPLKCFYSFNMAFFFQPYLHRVVCHMKSPRLSNVFTTVASSMTTCLILSIAIGLLGYFSFWSFEDEENIFDIIDSNSIISPILKFFALFGTLFAITIYLIIIARESCEFFVKGCAESGFLVILMAITVGTLGTAVMDLESKIRTYLELVRSVFIVILAYIFPPVFFLSLYSFKSVVVGVLSVVLLAFGILALIFIFYTSYA